MRQLVVGALDGPVHAKGHAIAKTRANFNRSIAGHPGDLVSNGLPAVLTWVRHGKRSRELSGL